jgi:hypothetical protein
MNQENQNLEARIKASLDANAHHLDADTKKRLQEIRLKALKQSGLGAWFKANYLLPTAGLALCSVFAIMLALPHLHHKPSDTAIDQTAMLELIENPDELDALSDPGFYVWMDEIEEKEDAANAA